MATSNLNQKYTIEKYCSKIELSRALGTNLIEPFWREISEFRRKFAVELPLVDATRNKFFLTYIDSVQAKTAHANDRVTNFVNSIAKLSNGSISRYTFTRDMIKNSLREIARFNKIDVSDITLSNILDENPVEQKYITLAKYYRALNELRNNTYDNIDDSFLAKNYAILRGEEELICFYRENDVITASSQALVSRDYDQGVPSHLIDSLMNDLLEYINNFDISIVTRIAAIFFMFNYIKPFEVYNMELASLLAKRLLSSTSIDTSSIYIPIESFINDSQFFNEITREVKRTHDFTYAFLKASDLINNAFDISINRILEVHGSSLDQEVKIGSDEKKIKEEFGIKVEKPVIKEAKPLTKKEIQTVLESRVVTKEEPLSEKELKQRANDLLESNPFLKKGQAHFYVRHCTIGKYYTIQQYVKAEGCVYETARTSMDNLAKPGYYRREQIKNKFVYTPISKE